MSASWQRILGLMIVSAWLAAGCTSPKKIDVGGTCILNSDCGGSLVCTWGICHVACHASADCQRGESCIAVSDQSMVCQKPTSCTYNSDCQAGLVCAVDQQCRQQCKGDVDCTHGQTCTTTGTCAEQSQVDSNKNLLIPDGGLSGTGGTGGGGTGGSTSPKPDASPDLPADMPGSPGGSGGSAGGTSGVGGSSGTGGASGTGTGGSISPNPDASPDLPADVPGGTGGVSSTGGILSTAGVTSVVDARGTGGTVAAGANGNLDAPGTGGTVAIGGTTNSGGSTGAGGTTNLPDAAVDLNTAAPDAIPTPSQTVALFHFDGIATPTVLTDSSGTGKVATITGNPVISTTQSMFGGASLYIHGNATAHTNYVASQSPDFVLGTEWTMDWWQYIESYTDSYGGVVIVTNSATPFACQGGMSGDAAGSGWSPSYRPSTGVWHHIAVVGHAGQVLIFWDGALNSQNAIGSVAGPYLSISGGPCAPGGDSDWGDLDGYIDELRVVRGTAVWTSDFTPPTAEY
jgi:hypothetical protein